MALSSQSSVGGLEVSLEFERHVCYEKELIQNSQNTFWSEHEGKKWLSVSSLAWSQPPT